MDSKNGIIIAMFFGITKHIENYDKKTAKPLISSAKSFSWLFGLHTPGELTSGNAFRAKNSGGLARLPFYGNLGTFNHRIGNGKHL